MNWLAKGESAVGRYGVLFGGILAIVASAGFTLAMWERLRHHSITWNWVAGMAVGALILVLLAYLLGRRSYRRLSPESAERAQQELEVARSYLTHVVDFMGELRMALSHLPEEEAKRRLESLRDLVFDAIIQGINTSPGEHVRCALFEPVTEGGERWLKVRHSKGHTARVEHLRLSMNSAAGRAFTQRKPVYIPKARNHPLVEATTAGRPVETLFCIPAYAFAAGPKGASEPSGVFSVASNKANAFSSSDRQFISACADMVVLIGLFTSVQEALIKVKESLAKFGTVDPEEQTPAPPLPERPGLEPKSR